MAKTGKDKTILNKLQRQLVMKRLEIKKGVIQNATFMTADPDHTTVDTPKGDAAKTRRSNDAILTKKNSKSYLGFKVHTKEDFDFGLIREL